MRSFHRFLPIVLLAAAVGCATEAPVEAPQQATFLDIPKIQLRCTIQLDRSQFPPDAAIPVTFTVENTSDFHILPYLHLKTGEQQYCGGESIEVGPREKKEHVIVISPKYFSNPGEKSISVVAYSGSLTSGHPIQEFSVVCTPVKIQIVR